MLPNRTHRMTRRVCSLGAAVLAAAVLGGCLNRPIAEPVPETDNLFIKQNPSGGVDKIDVLFMIDNSLSMGDKQQVLAAAVPQLLRRLTNPDCVDPGGDASKTQHLGDPSTSCPTGLQREFAPVKDIHIGIVTSSLGAFGGDSCPTDGPQNAPQNDHAWLLGALPRTASTLNGQAFLSWTADDARNYGTQINNKVNEFGTFVSAATENGCGNEMQLESWYRFLVDPKPPTDITTANQGPNQRGPVDNNILQQRKAFLRPDSLVAILVLTDENDCSMRDTSYSWVAMTAGNGFRMWRGSSACDQNPNDPCCYSCMLDSLASDSCKAKDTSCRQNDPSARLAPADDDVNVRCRMTKKRFGYDFLFPPSRYVNALIQPKICPDQDFGDLDCNCTVAKQKGIACNPGPAVDNPLYVNLDPTSIPTGPIRTGPESVFPGVIVGVPWQDLAVDPSDSATLEYKRASQLDWDLFSPKPNEDYSLAQLGDPLMIESFSPRTGTHPITKEPLAPPEAGYRANKINGHEYRTANKDVQFACIFSLDVQLTSSATHATRVCDLVSMCGSDDGSDAYKICARKFEGCSCALSPGDQKNSTDPTVSLVPICQNPQNQYTNQQYFAKAQPALRQLQVMRGFYETTHSDNAIVASICPKDLDYRNRETSGYGYNPAVKSLVDRLKDKLGGTCLPRQLDVQADGTVPCAIIEAISSPDRNWCNCSANGRTAVSSDMAAAIKAEMESERICGSDPLPSCDAFCLCQLPELLPGTSGGDSCLNQVNVEKSSSAPGFCYVDPSQNHGSDAVVAGCPGSQKRIIRIVGTGQDYTAAPAPGKVIIACSGAAYSAPANDSPAKAQN